MVKKLHSHEIGWKKIHIPIEISSLKLQNRELSIKEADVWILFDKRTFNKYIEPPSHYQAIGFLDKGAVSL